MQTVSDDDVQKRFLEKPRFELARKVYDIYIEYVWNIAQMMLFNYTCPEEMTVPPNFVPPFPWDKAPLLSIPTMPSVGLCLYQNNMGDLVV